MCYLVPTFIISVSLLSPSLTCEEVLHLLLILPCFGRTGIGLGSGDSRAAPERFGGGSLGGVFHSVTMPESESKEDVGEFAGTLSAGGLGRGSAGLFEGDAEFFLALAMDLAFLRNFLADGRAGGGRRRLCVSRHSFAGRRHLVSPPSQLLELPQVLPLLLKDAEFKLIGRGACVWDRMMKKRGAARHG